MKQEKKLRMILSVWFLLLALAVGLFVFYIGWIAGNKALDDVHRIENPINRYWSCMDGCYNMGEQIYGRPNWSLYHAEDEGECDARCYRQYVQGVYP